MNFDLRESFNKGIDEFIRVLSVRNQEILRGHPIEFVDYSIR